MDPTHPRSFATARVSSRVLAGAAALALFAGCDKPSPTPAAPAFTAGDDVVKLSSDTQRSPLKFTVEQALEHTPLPLLPVTARVSTVATLTSPTFAPLSGRVVSVNTRLGDRVAQGDRLVEVRTAELSTLRHDLHAAQLAIKTRVAAVKRLEQLVAVRMATESELSVARSELDEARLAAVTASDRIKGLSLKESGATTYWITAPRAGTVVWLDAAPGKHVAPDDKKPVATLADLDRLVVLADVPQRDAGRISAGQRASILFPDGLDPEIEGSIESISEVVDPERQTVPVRVLVRNERRLLRPNAFVSVLFAPASDRRVVIVPSSAVVSDGARSVVFVEVEQGTFRRRPVELGRRTKERVEILQGLAPAERVVTSGALLLLNALEVEG